MEAQVNKKLRGIKLRDRTLGDGAGSPIYNNPMIDWQIDAAPTDVTVYTDLCLDEALEDVTSLKKVAWLIESPKVNYRAYRKIKKMACKFDQVFTCSRKHIEKGGPFKFCHTGWCWIPEASRGIHEKRWNVSIISSKKKWLKGHKLRHKIINRLRDDIDLVLSGSFTEAARNDALQHYRYSIIIENHREDFYFTEKLLDCFVTGVVPIYWGCPSIGKFFDEQGILSFKNLRELKNILKNVVSESDYAGRMDAIKGNYELAAQKYLWPEATIREGLEELCSDLLDNE